MKNKVHQFFNLDEKGINMSKKIVIDFVDGSGGVSITGFDDDNKVIALPLNCANELTSVIFKYMKELQECGFNLEMVSFEQI